MSKTIKSPLLITLCLTRTTYDDRINVDHFSITYIRNSSLPIHSIIQRTLVKIIKIIANIVMQTLMFETVFTIINRHTQSGWVSYIRLLS
jgi:precorrin-6B methylase 2